MATYPVISSGQVSDDSQIWNSLKMAISASSGFQRWQIDRQQIDNECHNTSIDYRVRRYLRETLETLAY